MKTRMRERERTRQEREGKQKKVWGWLTTRVSRRLSFSVIMDMGGTYWIDEWDGWHARPM